MTLNGKSSARRLGRILATSGAALVGYLGLGLTLWQIIPSVMAQIIYVETAGLAGLTILALYQAALVARLQQANFEMALRFADAEYISNLAQGMFSLVVNLIEEPRTDSEHHFQCITEEFVVQGNDGTFNWTFDGTCHATRSNALVLKVSGDSPSDIDALDISVTDELKGRTALTYDVLTDRPYCKVIQIYFKRTLRTGEPFKVRFSCRWNNTFPQSRQKDYVFSSWASYAQAGIDRISGKLVIDQAVDSVKLEKLQDGTWVATSHQPRVMDSSRSRTEIEWNIANPAHVYLISFRKPTT